MKELGGLIRGGCLEEGQFRPSYSREGPGSDLWELGTVRLLSDLGHVLALLSLSLPVLQ